MHVCLFDIDGTLLNTGGAGQAAMEAALASEFAASGPVTGISMAGRTDRAIAADLFKFYQLEQTVDTFSRFLQAYLGHLPGSLRDRDGLVLPGIRTVLHRLSQREDVLLGLLTGNFRDGARLKLIHYELDHHFEFGGFGDDHLTRDDVARDALNQVRERLGARLSLERVWVIGDTPADIGCARAIGARVVAVGTGLFSLDELHAAGPDHLIPDFSEPESLLDLLRPL